MKKIEVVAAIIHFEDKILCVQRPKNKYNYISEKFEFPRGKVEEGETKEEALNREILEELKITVKLKDFFMTVVHQYPDFELTMHTYSCEVKTKELTLTEHIALEWLAPNELKRLDWAAADIPIVDKLVNYG